MDFLEVSHEDKRKYRHIYSVKKCRKCKFILKETRKVELPSCPKCGSTNLELIPSPTGSNAVCRKCRWRFELKRKERY
jgi:Zn finger protein HypA/HybF involved in hydrogenase expression